MVELVLNAGMENLEVTLIQLTFKGVRTKGP